MICLHCSKTGRESKETNKEGITSEVHSCGRHSTRIMVQDKNYYKIYHDPHSHMTPETFDRDYRAMYVDHFKRIPVSEKTKK